jgi:hypothetical protein
MVGFVSFLPRFWIFCWFCSSLYTTYLSHIYCIFCWKRSLFINKSNTMKLFNRVIFSHLIQDFAVYVLSVCHISMHPRWYYCTKKYLIPRFYARKYYCMHWSSVSHFFIFTSASNTMLV